MQRRGSRVAGTRMVICCNAREGRFVCSDLSLGRRREVVGVEFRSSRSGDENANGIVSGDS